MKPNRFRQALTVQDACNLRGIARLLVQAADEAGDEGGGSEATNRDPAVVLIVNKLDSLVHSDRNYSDAFTACHEKA